MKNGKIKKVSGQRVVCVLGKRKHKLLSDVEI